MITHLLNRTVDVWREETEPDGSGGWTTEWVRVLEGAATRIAQPTPEERFVAMQAGANLDARAYFGSGVEVHRGDELRDSDETYRVTSTIYPSTPGVYVRADCERIQRAEGGPS